MRAINNLTGFLFGLAIAALLFLMMAPKSHGNDADEHEDLSRLPMTDPVIVVTRHGKEMTGSPAKVGQIEDGSALLCFRQMSPDKTLVSCFVINKLTGQILLLQLPVDETSI